MANNYFSGVNTTPNSPRGELYSPKGDTSVNNYQAITKLLCDQRSKIDKILNKT